MNVFNKYKIFYVLYLDKQGKKEIFKHQDKNITIGYAMAYCDINKIKDLYFQIIEILIDSGSIEHVNKLFEIQ